MSISTSTYYYKTKKSRIERETEDADLKDKIEDLQENYSCWGYRTIRHQLQRIYGLKVNSKKILRIMRKYNLFRRMKRKFITTTDSNHPFRIYPNLIKGKTITGINQVWVSDITYIRILSGFVFLAVILDVFSRRVIGWALSKIIDHNLTVAALQMAIKNRDPKAGLIHHSDQGVQYACKDYIKILNEHDIEISMASKGNPYQNAFVESFFKTLKNEEVYLWQYESFVDVIERIPEFIEQVYNKKRVHSGIKYLPPDDFEAILQDMFKRKTLGQDILNLKLK